MGTNSKLTRRTVIALATFALLIMVMTTRLTIAQSHAKQSPLVVRVAVFASDQGTLEDRSDWIEHHLFPALRTVHGHAGTFLARDPESGELISLSFWETADAMRAAEQAVGREIGSMPAGAAPRPSWVKRYVVEYRDGQGAMK